MKEIGILFTTPMVQAIGDDRKTLTRRTRGLKEINEAPDDWSLCWCGDTVVHNKKTAFGAMFRHNKTGKLLFIKSPYGQPGDLLWVRETFAYVLEDKCGPVYDSIIFKADDNEGWEYGWLPSIHMPKAAARYWLKVKSVRPERIQEITEEDAIAEGIFKIPFKDDDMPECIGYSWFNDGKNSLHTTARFAFKYLIISINGPEIWDQNQWVWRIEFERTNKPTTV